MRSDRCDHKGYDGGQNEVKDPSIHNAQRLGHNDHKSGGNGGKTSGDDSGFFRCVAFFLINPIGDQQSQGVAAHEGSDGVNGRAARSAPDRTHDFFHINADKFHQTELSNESQEN
ncbi:hypothetical protein SDC9_182441 [bioreactor metagenome]|uniref:Uncharacterized protein n=1 Tax=bioreactor metagenome TaxID=1076179 RepID=A0A645H7E8_9ZZZZ